MTQRWTWTCSTFADIKRSHIDTEAPICPCSRTEGPLKCLLVIERVSWGEAKHFPFILLLTGEIDASKQRRKSRDDVCERKYIGGNIL